MPRPGGGTWDLLVFVYFLSLEQRLRPLDYCAPFERADLVAVPEEGGFGRQEQEEEEEEADLEGEHQGVGGDRRLVTFLSKKFLKKKIQLFLFYLWLRKKKKKCIKVSFIKNKPKLESKFHPLSSSVQQAMSGSIGPNSLLDRLNLNASCSQLTNRNSKACSWHGPISGPSSLVILKKSVL